MPSAPRRSPEREDPGPRRSEKRAASPQADPRRPQLCRGRRGGLAPSRQGCDGGSADRSLPGRRAIVRELYGPRRAGVPLVGARDRAERSHDHGHRFDRALRDKGGHASRRAGLRAEGRAEPGDAPADHRGDARAPSSQGRSPAPPPARREDVGHGCPRRLVAGDGPRAPPHRAARRGRCAGPDPRRDGDGQGAGSACATRDERAARSAVSRHQLLRPSWHSHRVHDLRARAGRLHRRRSTCARPPRAGRAGNHPARRDRGDAHRAASEASSRPRGSAIPTPWLGDRASAPRARARGNPHRSRGAHRRRALP